MNGLIEYRGRGAVTPVEAVDHKHLAACKRRLGAAGPALAGRLRIRAGPGRVALMPDDKQRPGARAGRCRRQPAAAGAGRAAAARCRRTATASDEAGVALDTAPGRAGLGAGRLPLRPLPRERPHARAAGARRAPNCTRSSRRWRRSAWSATWSPRRPRTWARPRSPQTIRSLARKHRGAGARMGRRRPAQGQLPHHPRRRPRQPPPAAPGRDDLGQGRRPEAGAGRQGRVLRHRRPGPEAVRRHALDEEGHGRLGARHRPGLAGDGGQAAGAPDAAGADRGKCGRPATPSAPATWCAPAPATRWRSTTPTPRAA